jgi:tetratricopeptide (TPR) repeat protein
MDQYLEIYQKASAYLKSGLRDLAADHYIQVIRGGLELEKTSPSKGVETRSLLQMASDEYVDMLRWEGRYKEAINVLQSLLEIFPEEFVSLQIRIATLQIEAGEEAIGFSTLEEITRVYPNLIWGWMTLAVDYIWIQDYDKAEKMLIQAASLKASSLSDRAMAYKYLFDIYSRLKRIDEAEQAWKKACTLDINMRVTLPELIRMFIYWYHYDRANEYIEQDHCCVRKKYYHWVISLRTSGFLQPEENNWIFDCLQEDQQEGKEELAEACLRLTHPHKAIDILEPMIQSGEFTGRQIILLGLAWAQARIPQKAKWALEIGLRIEDLERPRKSRPGKGDRRILDIESRIFYDEIIIDPDIRKEVVDPFFIPIAIP